MSSIFGYFNGSSESSKSEVTLPESLEKDRKVLLQALKEGGPSWSASLNWSDDLEVQYWNGVELDESETKVSGLFLTGFQLKGSLPSCLKELSCLKVLLADQNELSGPIPSDLISSCPSIDTICLQGNMFRGALTSSPSEGSPASTGGAKRALLLDNWNQPSHDKTWHAPATRTNSKGRTAFPGHSSRITALSKVCAEKLFYCCGPMDEDLPSSYSDGCTDRSVGDYPNVCGPASGNPCKSCLALVGLEYVQGACEKAEDIAKFVTITVSSGSNKERMMDGDKSTRWESSGSKPHGVEVASKEGNPLGGFKVYTKDYDSYSPSKVDIFKKTGQWISLRRRAKAVGLKSRR